MICTHCGHQSPADANFCGNCGRPLGVAPAAGAAAAGDVTGALYSGEPPTWAGVAPGDAEAGDGDAGPVVAVEELEAGTALLVAARGPNSGARFLLDRPVTTVGRHPESDIFLDDITVSRRHAELRVEAGGSQFWVYDVGSLNGTYVNGERADKRLLASGDEVQVGKFKLVAYLSGPAA